MIALPVSSPLPTGYVILTCNSSIIIIIIITIFLRSFYKNTTRKKAGHNAHGPCYAAFFRVFYEAARWGGKENALEFSSAAKGESRDPPNCRRTGGPPNWYRLSNSHQSPHGRTEEVSAREHSRQRERERLEKGGKKWRTGELTD